MWFNLYSNATMAIDMSRVLTNKTFNDLHYGTIVQLSFVLA